MNIGAIAQRLLGSLVRRMHRYRHRARVYTVGASNECEDKHEILSERTAEIFTSSIVDRCR